MKAPKAESEQPGLPTKAEMDILQILWDYGPSTVRFVNDKLNEQRRAVQYTSTLKQMQIMHQNGMLQRDESNMKHIYTAVLEEATTKGILSENFVDSHYEGSISKLLQYLFGRKKASPSELEAIKQLLNDTVEKKQ